MIFEILLAFLVLAIIYKKRIFNIVNIHLKYSIIFFISFLLQFLVVFLGSKEIKLILKFGPLVYVISFLLLLWVIYQNGHVKGMKIIFTGIFINFMAITMNGGQMPVSVEAMKNASLDKLYQTVQSGNYVTHVLMTKGDNFIAQIAGDIIAIPPPHPRPRVISIGDIIMTIGIIYMLYYYSKNKISE